jgi:hypothetical protein
MKKTFFYLILLLVSINSSFAQSEFGIKVGMSTYDIPKDDIQNSSDLKLSIKSASYGFQAGVYGRLGILGINIQPEILFNSNTYTYKLSNLNNVDSLDQIRSTKYQNLDIPVMVMFTPAFFKLYAGPVGHYHINNISDFKDKDNIKEVFKNLTYGYQLGAGITFSGLTFDVRYEGNISKSIKTFKIDGKTYDIDDSPSRVIFSLWFKL